PDLLPVAVAPSRASDRASKSGTGPATDLGTGPATDPGTELGTGSLDLMLAGAASSAGDPGQAGRQRRVRLLAAVAAVGAVIAATLVVIGLLVHAHGGSAGATATASASGQLAVSGGPAGRPDGKATGRAPSPAATRTATRATSDPASATPPATQTDPTDASPATDRVTVPDVIGEQAAAAESAVRAAGFATVERAYRSGSGARGTVVATDPQAGTTGAHADTVTLTVSAGPSTVTVPEVVGLDADDARAALRATGLTVVERVTSGPSAVDAGQVDAVAPVVGTRVAARSSVTITVVGDTVTVPDLRGRPAGEAKRTLTDLGLTVVQQPRAGGELPGTVVGQTPAARG
ncbi:PASTA domain-containing protein, partial [Frankia tisae]|uniref:PASTA domain-containing protein n=1 Tax=Frankia tisae TaxID=2950104 RepID=UPI0021C19B1D